MADVKFEEALAKFPTIAEAVNRFGAVELQAKAFDILVRLFLGPIELQSPLLQDDKNARSGIDESTSARTPNDVPKRKRVAPNGANAPLRLVNDLDLRPKGKPAFKDFFSEKNPKNDPEVFVVMVYYLKKFIELQKINQDHLYTCFKHLERKVPNLQSGLNNARSRKGYIDCSDFNDIKITRVGENFVEHDMVRKPKDK